MPYKNDFEKARDFLEERNLEQRYLDENEKPQYRHHLLFHKKTFLEAFKEWCLGLGIVLAIELIISGIWPITLILMTLFVLVGCL